MKKKILALCLVVVLSITAVTGATLAYFTDFDKVDNEYTIGKTGFAIDLWENVEHTDGAENVLDTLTNIGKGDDTKTGYKFKDIMPGDTMEKIATVENTGDSAAYIALTIKHEGYLNFNQKIDDYYEAMNVDQWKALGLGDDKDEVMQNVTDAIFPGWKLSYTKDGDNDLRYEFTEKPGTTAGGAQILGYGYANSTKKLVDGTYVDAWNYKDSCNMFTNQNGCTSADMAGNFDSLTPEHTRMWVVYLQVPVGGSYEIDLTTACPGFIDTASLEAFNGMHLDVKAFAIQDYGFKTANEAFNTLFEAENCFAY